MDLLKKGCQGIDVIDLQNALNKWDYTLKVDGEFGEITDRAVRNFQSAVHITADGLVGKNTWKILQDPERLQLFQLRIKEEDYLRAAQMLGVEVAVVKAVQEVETGGKGGFYSIGHPAILFEGHIFWKELNKVGLSPENYVAGREDILYPKWTKVYYTGDSREYSRLGRAMIVDQHSALRSASWGAFQIMGFNFNLCGCSTINEFVAKMHESEGAQLDLFIAFIKHNNLDKPLREHNWAEFAKRYNGASYAQNSYDTRLESAYKKYLA